jgi:RNA-binding protein YlmH
MKDKDKILHYFAASGEEAEEMAVRLLDLADSVDRGRPFAVSSFMSPLAAQIGQTVAAHMTGVDVKVWGGFHEAERVKVAFYRSEYQGTIDFAIDVLEVSWDDRYRLIGHRDVLGSLMGLGIKRSVLGDILMHGSTCQILCDHSIAEWIRLNLKKIAMASVAVQEIPLDQIEPPKQKAKEIRSTVASLRLDAVAASGFGISRSKMAKYISDERTEVNWAQAKSVSQEVKPGDVISIRGRGRIEIKEITGKSRKGRIGLLIERYR